MAKKRQLTVEDRQTIVDLKREGLSCREIAKKVQVSVNAVSYTVKRHSETGGNWDRNRSGRPKATTKMEDKFLRITSRRNEQLTAQQLRAQLNLGRRKQVSLSTVNRRLHAAGLSSWVSVGKPSLKVQMKNEEEPLLKVKMMKKKAEAPLLKGQKKKKPLLKVQMKKVEEPLLKGQEKQKVEEPLLKGQEKQKVEEPLLKVQEKEAPLLIVEEKGKKPLLKEPLLKLQEKEEEPLLKVPEKEAPLLKVQEKGKKPLLKEPLLKVQEKEEEPLLKVQEKEAPLLKVQEKGKRPLLREPLLKLQEKKQLGHAERPLHLWCPQPR